MSKLPAHVEPLWSRVDDLAERLERSDEAVRDLYRRTNKMIERIGALEAQVSRVIDLVAYQAQPAGEPVDSAGMCVCGHAYSRHYTVGEGDDVRVCMAPDCSCEVFRPVVERTSDDLTIARMEALETAIAFIDDHALVDDHGMASIVMVLQTWLDELSDPAVPR